MNKIELICGDCFVETKKIPDNSIDACVTDPPYGIGFMGKGWDTFSPKYIEKHKKELAKELKIKPRTDGRNVPATGIAMRAGQYDLSLKGLVGFQKWYCEIMKECLRVLKPGGFLLSFGGSRTYHRMACAIEDAGFEIRDQIMWVYGSGFPKSLNIGKVMDKFLKTGNASWNGTGDSSNGALGYSKLQHQQDYRPDDYSNRHQNKSEITEEKAKHWEGYGTALKPAHEPIVLARKPLSEKTVVANILKWGVGGINIDGCRVGMESISVHDAPKGTFAGKYDGGWFGKKSGTTVYNYHKGRFPANFIHDGSQEVMDLFPNTGQKGKCYDYSGKKEYQVEGFIPNNKPNSPSNRGDSGSAARFFYCAKASSKERNDGLDDLKDKPAFDYGSIKKSVGRHGVNTPRKNHHPTVKPISLMIYLTKLVTPPNGLVLDPFMGSGTTAIACIENNFRFIGFEKQKEYFDIAKTRIERSSDEKKN